MADQSLLSVGRIDTLRHAGLRADVAAMLAHTFDRDAHFNWIVRQDEGRQPAFQRLFELMLSDLLGRHGEVYATADLGAAAIWYPPHADPLGFAAQARVALRFASITGWRNWLLRAYGLNRMAMRHPDLPHYFLQTLGVDRAKRGRGYGSALLTVLTDRCDQEDSACLLETSSPASVRFYEKHGFRIIGTPRLPRGPTLWLMLRAP